MIAYNQDVIDGWSLRIRGEPTPQVSADLDRLCGTVAGRRPMTPAQRAFVEDAMVRLDRVLMTAQALHRTPADRITLDQLWDVEAEEADHAQETLDSGFCVGIWNVAAQKRIIAIIDSPDAEDLDRVHNAPR